MTDDHDLLARLAAGDDDAYATVFRTWYASLVRFVDAMLRQRDEAEEVVQELMLELWNRRTQLDPAQPVQGWLFRAARNRALNVLRHRGVRAATAPDVVALAAEPLPTDALASADEMAAALHEALAELPPRCREVFALSRRDGLRNAEIAERLGISVKGVEAQMARALRKLREQLRPWLPEGESL